MTLAVRACAGSLVNQRASSSRPLDPSGIAKSLI